MTYESWCWNYKFDFSGGHGKSSPVESAPLIELSKFRAIGAELEKTRYIKVFFDLRWLTNTLADTRLTRAESSEVLCYSARRSVLPTGRSLPDCLISHIIHTLFITITKAALQGNGPWRHAAWKRVNRLNEAFGTSLRTKRVVQHWEKTSFYQSEMVSLSEPQINGTLLSAMLWNAAPVSVL